MRAALTPAPVPPRAALSSPELFLGKGRPCLERLSCPVSQGLGFGRVWLGVPPAADSFPPFLHGPPTPGTFSFPFCYFQTRVRTLGQQQSQSQ